MRLVPDVFIGPRSSSEHLIVYEIIEKGSCKDNNGESFQIPGTGTSSKNLTEGMSLLVVPRSMICPAHRQADDGVRFLSSPVLEFVPNQNASLALRTIEGR